MQGCYFLENEKKHLLFERGGGEMTYEELEEIRTYVIPFDITGIEHQTEI